MPAKTLQKSTRWKGSPTYQKKSSESAKGSETFIINKLSAETNGTLSSIFTTPISNNNGSSSTIAATSNPTYVTSGSRNRIRNDPQDPLAS